MVRSKNFTVASGRKQRIEGIVKNLSAKVRTKKGISAFNGVAQSPSESSEPLSISLIQQRGEGQCSTITADDSDSVYHLPSGLEFSGIVSSQLLSRGKQFGPFIGRIVSEGEHIALSHSIVCQIPDFDGNTYSLCLLTRVLESCKWLKCLKRCYSNGSYNVVAYNTPKGVVLETMSGVAVGAELCVVYDHSYDTNEVTVHENDIVDIAAEEPAAEETTKNIVNVSDSYFTSSPCDENNTTYVKRANVTRGQSNPDTNETGDELAQHSEPTYRVLTADVSDQLNSIKEDEQAVYEESTSTRTQKKFEQKGRQCTAKPYRCHSCKKQFETLDQKQQHLDTNHTTECPLCNKVYSRAYLKEHMMFHLESARVTCSICSKIFSSISNLRKHQKKHTRRSIASTVAAEKLPLFQCSECPKAFKYEKYLETHRKKHVRVVPISCDECEEVFTNKSLLKSHNAITHQGKKPYSCKHCDKTFTQSGNLSRHCRQAHADMKEVRERATKEKFLCRRRGCDQKAFTSREVFIKHLEQHSGSKGVFPCGECSSVFSSSSNLSKHRKSQHGRKIKTEPGQQVKFSCDLCKTDFQNQALYHMHLSEHKISKEENKCEQCGKAFANRSGLFKHVRLFRCSVTKKSKPPKAEKIYECSDCNKTFLSASDLRTHRRTHSIVNLFACEICGKSFNQPGNLGKHKRHVHQGIPRPKEKPRSKKLTCHVCNKTLSTSAALQLHTRLHVGIKPFKCEHCGVGFTQAGLKKHRCKKLNNTVRPPNGQQPNGDHNQMMMAPVTSENTTEHIPMPNVLTSLVRSWHDNNHDALAKVAEEMEEFPPPPGSPVF